MFGDLKLFARKIVWISINVGEKMFRLKSWKTYVYKWKIFS